MKLHDFFRNLSGKNLTWSVSVHSFTLMLTWKPIFDRQLSPKMKNPFLKWRKSSFLIVTFMLSAHITVPLLVLIAFRSISALSWSFREIPKSKMAAIWQCWRDYHIIQRHHFHLPTSKETPLDVLSIAQASLSQLLYYWSYGGMPQKT